MDERTGILEWMKGWKDRNIGMKGWMKEQEYWNERMDERTGMLLEWMNRWNDRNVVGKDGWMDEMTWIGLDDKTSYVFNM